MLSGAPSWITHDADLLGRRRDLTLAGQGPTVLRRSARPSPGEAVTMLPATEVTEEILSGSLRWREWSIVDLPVTERSHGSRSGPPASNAPYSGGAQTPRVMSVIDRAAKWPIPVQKDHWPASILVPADPRARACPIRAGAWSTTRGRGPTALVPPLDVAGQGSLACA